MERVEAIVIGAGQAGLAASHELSVRGIEHVVLELGELGHTWRTKRWRSFHIVSPNSLNLLPGYEYDGPEPDAFLDTAGLLDYLAGYAASFAAPARTGVQVNEVRPADGRGHIVRTADRMLHTDHVIVASGAFGYASLPMMTAKLDPAIHSIHTDDYWAPEDLPPGGVLVVGVDGTRVTFAPGLEPLLRSGDDVARQFVHRIRDFARGCGEQVPEPDLDSRWREEELESLRAPESVDLAAEGIRTIIWSTGYRQDFSWIRVPGVLAENGAPYQHQGVSPVPGIHFVGLHRMWEAGSGTLLGCGWAATNVAEHILRSERRSPGQRCKSFSAI